jgi:hypothetical protein
MVRRRAGCQSWPEIVHLARDGAKRAADGPVDLFA